MTETLSYPEHIKTGRFAWQASVWSGPWNWTNDVAFIALGSNQSCAHGLPAHIMLAARQVLARDMDVLAASPLYVSNAWPDPADPPFLNAVLAVNWPNKTLDLLDLCHAVERRFGRERHARWAPRSLDLDILAHGARVLPDRTVWSEAEAAGMADVQTSGLYVPHPRALVRAFMTRPWADVAPDFSHPVSGQTIAVHARALDGAQACEPISWAKAETLHLL